MLRAAITTAFVGMTLMLTPPSHADTLNPRQPVTQYGDCVTSWVDPSEGTVGPYNPGRGPGTPQEPFPGVTMASAHGGHPRFEDAASCYNETD